MTDKPTPGNAADLLPWIACAVFFIAIAVGFALTGQWGPFIAVTAPWPLIAAAIWAVS